jgi:hypothetical protein
MTDHPGKGLRELGELLAALGVVLSLLFVAVQIRQTNALARVQISQDLAAGFREVNAPLEENADLAELFAAVMNDVPRSDFTRAEQLRVSAVYFTSVRLWESAWLAYREGIGQDRSLEGIGALGFFSTEYFRETWPLIRDAHDPEFVEFFEGLSWNR